MSTQPAPLAQLVGSCFVDRSGHRWWVKGPRPGSRGQYLVEAQMEGNYQRVALYVMTDREFQAHAHAAELTLDRSQRATSH
ncbi:hypothetical protein WG922_17775 [Ramlibacter sp. AN1015]|uniref:hypothetical protein n=1 Tax=Ramlibacter sp. AN1015 TaxID=3133428 RepID=UPI0030C3D6FF